MEHYLINLFSNLNAQLNFLYMHNNPTCHSFRATLASSPGATSLQLETWNNIRKLIRFSEKIFYIWFITLQLFAFPCVFLSIPFTFGRYIIQTTIFILESSFLTWDHFLSLNIFKNLPYSYFNYTLSWRFSGVGGSFLIQPIPSYKRIITSLLIRRKLN